MNLIRRTAAHYPDLGFYTKLVSFSIAAFLAFFLYTGKSKSTIGWVVCGVAAAVTLAVIAVDATRTLHSRRRDIA